MSKQINIMVVYASLMLTACGGGTWEIQKNSESSESDVNSRNVAVIERHPDRLSPRIKSFWHIDLGIYKYASGSYWNTLGTRDSVITPSGKVRVGAVLPYIPYNTELEFVTKPQHKYFLTWVCLPYPFLAIVDAKTSEYVAIDSYCPNCEGLIGTHLNESTQCVSNKFNPAWMQPDPEHHWLPWLMERKVYMYKNLCHAADKGVVSAQQRLGSLYFFGTEGFNKDKIRSFFWYQLAANAGDTESMEYVDLMKNNAGFMENHLYKVLSATDIEKADRLIKERQSGQCEKHILGEYKPKYELEINP